MATVPTPPAVPGPQPMPLIGSRSNFFRFLRDSIP